MWLNDGYTDLPPGKIANVVICLEMRERPPLRPEPGAAEYTLERLRASDIERYRALFTAIGAPYLWFSRLLLTDEQLVSVFRDERVEAFALRFDGADAGLLELDFRSPRECELMFFGLTNTLVGRGAGRWLMNRGIERAWSQPIDRFSVHTCSLDHPDAVQFYVRSGFVPYKRQIELCDDPRLTGVLPRDCAPSIPIV